LEQQQQQQQQMEWQVNLKSKKTYFPLQPVFSVTLGNGSVEKG
jgi:hypothetical protein